MENRDQVAAGGAGNAVNNAGGNQGVLNDIQKQIEQQKFLENTVSVGAGDENDTAMPDNFRERRDLEQYFFTKNVLS